MGLDAQSEVTRFVDRGLQFFEREFLRFGITAVGQYGPAGKSLDVIDTVVRELANDFSHFPRTVGFAIAQVPGKLDVRSKTRQRAGAAGNREVGASDEHARAYNIAAIDSVAQSNIAQGTIGSHSAHRGKPRLQHG